MTEHLNNLKLLNFRHNDSLFKFFIPSTNTQTILFSLTQIFKQNSSCTLFIVDYCMIKWYRFSVSFHFICQGFLLERHHSSPSKNMSQEKVNGSIIVITTRSLKSHYTLSQNENIFLQNVRLNSHLFYITFPFWLRHNVEESRSWLSEFPLSKLSVVA